MTFWDFAHQHECITLAIVFAVYAAVEVASSNAVLLAAALRGKK